MHDRVRLPTFAVVATGECEQFVARVHPKNAEPADRPTVEMDGRLIASAKAMAQLLIEAVGFAAEALERDEPVSGADLVEFHASWRFRVLRLLEGRSSGAPAQTVRHSRPTDSNCVPGNRGSAGCSYRTGDCS